MNNIIPFPRDKIVRIPPAVQQCPDVRVEFARRVERRLYEIEAPDIAEIRRLGEIAESCRPGDTEEA